MTDAPEFSRVIRLDTLGSANRDMTITAERAECAALAERFQLIAIEELRADASLSREGETVEALGQLSAKVIQRCVASAEPVPATIQESFRLRFVPELSAPDGDEIELSEEDCDILLYAGGAIDLGEAVAETLALALDPFPRSPNAEAVLREAGVVTEDEATIGPFSALKGLRDKLTTKR